MMNAISLPPPEPGRRMHPHAWLPLDQPLPENNAPRLDSVTWERPDPMPAIRHEPQACAHWPLDACAQIEAAARCLRVLAEIWTLEKSLTVPQSGRAGCIDLELLASAPLSGTLLHRIAQFPAQMRAQKQALRALADDFATVSVWLCGAAGSSWDAAKAVRQSLGLAVAPGESHRVIARDWLAADLNALMAAVLHRALGQLDQLMLTPSMIEADLAGQRVFGGLLCQTADTLDSAAAMACDATLFVEQFDKRWRLFRGQLADTIPVHSKAGQPPSHP